MADKLNPPGHPNPPPPPPRHRHHRNPPPPHDPGPPNPPGNPQNPPPNTPPNTPPGGGGTTPPPPPPPTSQSQNKAPWAAYLSILEDWGMDVTPEMIQFAHHAADQHWTTGSFMYFVRQTAWYKDFFKNIQPGMTEAQYNAKIDAFRNAAAAINYPINRTQAQALIGRQITVQTFQERISAIKKVNENWTFFQNFEQTLRVQGIIKPDQTVKKADLYKFVMHRGPVAWENVMNEAYARTAAAEAGLHVGYQLTRNQLHSIMSQVELNSSTPEQAFAAEQKGFATYAQAEQQGGKSGLGQFIGMHLSQKEMQDLSFGGPKALRAQNRLQSILDQYKEAIKAGVQPQLVETSTGAKLLGGLENLGGNPNSV